MRSAGSGSRRSDGRWQTCLTVTAADGTKERVWFIEDTQREMQEARDAHIREHGRGAKPRGTLEEAWREWERAEWGRLAPNSRRSHRWAETRILARFGGVRPGDVTTPDVARFLGALALEPKLSGRAIALHRSSLSSFYRFCVETGRSGANPALGVRLPVSQRPRARPMLTESLYRYARLSFRGDAALVYIRLMGECGLRPSEAIAARASDASVERRIRWLAVRGTKTEAAARRVPLPRDLDLSGLRPGVGLTFLHKHWGRLRKARPEFADLSLYALRKRALSRWAETGMPDEVLKSLAGHTDIALTKNVYIGVETRRLASTFSRLSMSAAYAEPSEEREKTPI